MKKTTKKMKKPAGGSGPKPETDERFSNVASDPKFYELSKKNRKVTLDKRFQSVLTDKKFGGKAAMDRRGRTVDISNQDDLRNIYDVESDEEEDATVGEKKPTVLDLARGEGNVSSSDDSDSSEDEEEVGLKGEEDDGHWAGLDHDVEHVEWASRRLAVCNMDWDRVTADDLFVLFSSFKAPTGTLIGITIYLSDFGKERTEKEEKEGPQIKLANSKDKEAATEAIRQYQLDRLKYYYAVLECDSVETASAIYEQCDGVEFEMSSVKMDLRFVPDEMEFEEERVKGRSNADNVNVNKYKPKYFESSAMANCRAQMTWDETDPERKRAMRDVFNAENVDDFKDLVAPGSSDEEEDDGDDAKPNALETLLRAAGENDNKGEKDLQVEWEPSLNVGSDEEEEGGMEMTFDDDEDQGAKMKKKDSQTPWEKYVEKRKIKKKERKAAIQAIRQAKKEEREANDAEATEKHKKRLAARKHEESLKAAPVDVNDDRFSALFTNSAFAIDKSNPLYKSANNLADVQVVEKRKRKIDQKGAAEIGEAVASSGPSTSSLIDKLKKRTENLKNKKRKLK